MKSVKIVMLFLLSALIGLSSCGSDDDDNRSVYEFSGNYVSNNAIEYLESVKPPMTIKGETISIDQMFSGYIYVSPIIQGDLDYNKSYLRITGLTDKGVLLSNFIVTINGQSKNLGNINTDFNSQTKDILDFLNETLQRVVSQQQLNVEMTFTSNRNLSMDDNVRLIINYDGIFKYLK